MSLPCNKRSRFLALTACVLGAVCTHRAGAAPVLKVCIDQASHTAVMDARVVRAAAKTQGYEILTVHFIGIGRGGDGFPVSRFSRMAQSDCQLVMGFPVDVSDPRLPPDLQATRAYASTGFVLVQRRGVAAPSLGELPQGSEVGIAQLDTYAGLLYRTHPNIVMHVYPEDSQMLADLQANQLAAGLAWQPSIESYLSHHLQQRALAIRIVPERHMRWDLVALYGAQSQGAASVFEDGIEALRSSGRLQRLIAPYQLAAAVDGTGGVPTAARWPRAHLQAAIAWSPDSTPAVRIADVGNSVPRKSRRIPALYTDEQASKGFVAYEQNCGMCHGPLLDGQAGGYSGPALKGPDFADPSYDFHLSDIFNFVAKLMPAGTPGSLTHEQDVVIMAYLLQQNGYPSGAQELTYEQAEKSKVPIRYYGK
jgi:mono/diheme cytochrome c family protein